MIDRFLGESASKIFLGEELIGGGQMTKGQEMRNCCHRTSTSFLVAILAGGSSGRWLLSC